MTPEDGGPLDEELVLVIVGLILHLGIAVVFPIPLFGLLMVAMYINFFP